MTGPARPDDLSRSPSGRIPQWVIDEANGKTTAPVPFRSDPTPPVPPAAGRRKRWTRVLLTVLVVGGVIALGVAKGFDKNGGGLAASSRTRTERQRPPLGHEEAKHPLGTPPTVTAPTSAYRFVMHQDDQTAPVTWSPCRPIHYVVRPDNAPANGDRLVTEAIARLSKATGFRFVYDGTTTEAPSEDRHVYQKDRYGDRWAPVLVSWPTLDEVPDFGIDYVGEARPFPARSGSGDLVYISGEVFLDPVGLTQYGKKYGEPAARAVVMHELGHLLGLAHVNDKAQVMYPAANSHVLEYGAGDLTGLHALATGPCQRDV